MRINFMDISTFLCRRSQHVQQGVSTGRLAAGPGGVSEGLVLWLKASDVVAQEGQAVESWVNAVGGAPATQSSVSSQPRYYAEALNGNPALMFDGDDDFLQGSLYLPVDKTILAAFRDTGSSTPCCSGMFYTDGDNGLETANLTGQTYLIADWAGSTQFGQTVITNQSVVAAVIYNETETTLYHFSCVDNVLQQSYGAESLSYMVGSRGNQLDRYFKGLISEIIVYNRSLTESEQMTVELYLEQQVRDNIVLCLEVVLV